MKFHTDEINFTNEILNSLEWVERKLEGKKVNVLYCNYFPVMINKTFLVKLSRHEEKIKDVEFTFFRPIRNGKHCQIMIDGAYEIDESINEIVTTRDTKSKKFTGWLETNDGKKIKVSKQLYTESEIKFALLYLYWFDKDISNKLIEIHEFNDKYKSEQIEVRNKDKNRSKLKIPRMN